MRSPQWPSDFSFICDWNRHELYLHLIYLPLVPFGLTVSYQYDRLLSLFPLINDEIIKIVSNFLAPYSPVDIFPTVYIEMVGCLEGYFTLRGISQ